MPANNNNHCKDPTYPSHIEKVVTSWECKPWLKCEDCTTPVELCQGQRETLLFCSRNYYLVSPQAGIMNETVVANHLQNKHWSTSYSSLQQKNRNGKNVPRFFSSFTSTFELDRWRRGTNDVRWIAVEERKHKLFCYMENLLVRTKKNTDCSVAQKAWLFHTIKTIWQQRAIQIGRPSTLTHVSPTLSVAQL